MDSFGIYFGPKTITIAQARGGRLLNSVRIPQPAVSADSLEEESLAKARLIQLVALIKDELRKNKLEAKKVNLCLSGRDLIIRTFEIPLLPRAELKSAVNFEAKKYIPFKGEDIVSDFQIEYDRTHKLNQALFVAIKKQSLERYVSVLGQLGLEIEGIEYSAFSLLKFLKAAGQRSDSITALISADLEEEDETNFLVLKDGFPLFSRDFTLFELTELAAKTQSTPDRGAALEKLKNEIRVSLDYFHRKFSDKSIQRAVLISNPAYHSELEAMMKELGLPAQFVAFNKLDRILGRAFSFNLDLLKGYSSSLNIGTKLKLHLLAARGKPEAEEAAASAISERLLDFLIGLRIDFRVVVAAVLLCAAVVGAGILRTLPVKKELQGIIASRPQAGSVSADASYQELTGTEAGYQKKLKTFDKLIKGQLYLTEVLDVIPRVMPEGLWLNDFKYRNEDNKQAELLMQGTCYLGDRARELEAIDKFLSDLRADPGFRKFFKTLTIVSVERKEAPGGIEVSDFTVSAKGGN